MAEVILARLDQSAERVRWRLLSNSQTVGKAPQDSDIHEFKSLSAGYRVIYLFPAESVLLRQLQLPQVRGAKRDRLVAYALEEDLAEDIEQLHFVYDSSAQNAEVNVVVCRQDHLNAFKACLQRFGLSAEYLFADVLLLPRQEDEVMLLIDAENRAYCRTAQFSGFITTLERLPHMLKKLFADNGMTSRRLRCVLESTATVPDGLRADLETLGIELTQSVSDFWQELSYSDALKPLNLLATPKSSQQGFASLSVKSLLVSIMLLLSATAMLLAAKGYDYIRLEQQNRQLSTTITTRFQQHFPDVKRVIDPVVQARQKLAARLQTSDSHDDFLAALYAFGEAARDLSELTIEAIDYAEGVLQIKTSSESVAPVEYVVEIIDNPELQAEVSSTRISDGRVHAQIRIDRR